MTPLALFASLLACDNFSSSSLMDCASGNTRACYQDGLQAAQAAKPRYDVARASFNAACRPSRADGGAGLGEHVPEACHELALLVRDAKGGPRDEPRAAELFEIACKGGLDRSCVDLASLLYTTDPAHEQDAVRAAVFFDQSCGKIDLTSLPPSGPHPLADACDGLGAAYEDGVGVVPPGQDLEKAAKYYDLACRAQYAPGCVHAGDLAAATRSKADIVRAAELYDKACHLDARHGCFDLAELHANKVVADASDQVAAENYKRACSIDATRGCFEAGAMMEAGRVKAGEGEIASMYNQACEHGHTEACARRAANQRW